MNKLSFRSGAAVALIMISSLAVAQSQPQAPDKPALAPSTGFNENYGVPIDITQAKKVAAAAEAEARKHGVDTTLTLAIVDDGGDIVYVQRGTSPIAAMDIALAEARSASYYGVSTKMFYDALKKDEFKSSISLPMSASMADAAGLPIIVNGAIIGAIGVTGGYEKEVADAGVRALAAQGEAFDSAAETRHTTESEKVSKPLLYGVSVDLRQVRRMIAAAEAEAKKRHITSFTMVVDDTNGDPVYAQAALGARRAAIEITLAKARMAARYGVTSKSVNDLLVAGDLTRSLALPGAATMGWGGVPLIARGRIIGGVAVAGVRNPNDHAIASAAAAAVAQDDPLAAH